MIPTNSTLAKFRYLGGYMAPYWRQMFMAILALVLGSLLILALPLTLRTMVDTVFVARDVTRLTQLSLGLLFMFALQSVMIWLQTYWFTFIADRIVANVRLDVYNHLLALPLSFFNNRQLGEIISRVTSDVMVVQIALTETPTSLLRQFIIFLGGLVMIAWLEGQLILVILLLALPVIVIVKYLGRNLQALAVEAQDTSAGLSATIEDTLSGMREVKAFGREQDEQVYFEQKTDVRFAALMRQNRARAWLIAVVAFLGFAGISLLLWYGGRQVIAGALTPGEMIAVIIYMGVVISPVAEFAGQYANIQAALGAIRRVYEIMHLTPEPLNTPQRFQGVQKPLRSETPLPPVMGRVHFKDVSFHYEAAKPVLKNINLNLEPGQVLTIVGPSGTGKTTLVNLLLRFYDLPAGCIEIDGYDISRVNLTSLRRQIGLIPQDTFLFSRSVGENIAYGRPGATQDDIVAAARAAYAHDFITALPHGYDTLVGDRGSKLSAGQRQRIAIARMFLKDPRILILDEAMTSLDPETEHWIEAALTRLMHGRTTFIITHHLLNVQHAAGIVVLVDGMIVEQGTFNDLLALGGVFSRLYSPPEKFLPGFGD